MSDAPFPKLERFEVLHRLGEGGMGVVYEAKDREHGTHVALKTLRRFDAETLLYLKQEFRALQDIQHPNLVALGELTRDGDIWFFTMELVPGVDLVSYVGGRRERQVDRDDEITRADTSAREPSSSRRGDLDLGGEIPRPLAVDLAKLRPSLAQLATALRALHAAGKIHRDVKPSNVLVTGEGRVVLLDFGLVLDAGGLQPESSIVGSARYMAPEQAAHEEVSAAADWYSFGVILYECLAGRPPFDGDATRVLERKLMEVAPRPSLRGVGVPRDLDDLCARLLDRDPGKRPTGQEIIRRLVGSLEATRAAPLGRAPFVGREPEIAALRAAFDRVQTGRAVAVVVVGESGIGKSALVRHVVESLESEAHRAPRLLVLAGRCYEREVVPYKALDGVMDALCRHLGPLEDADVAALFPAPAPLLTQAFPVLRRLARLDVAARQRRSRPDLAGHESRTRFFETVRALFGRLAEKYRLVVVIDDLHWADADSLALLGEILRPGGAPRMLLLMTSRPTASEATPFGLPGDVVTLRLGRLERAHTLVLARALLGGPDDTGASRVVEAIEAEAEGHPLFVDELVRHARELGGGALGASDAARPREFRLDEALGLRVARLAPQDRALIELLAVAGVSLSRETAMRAAEVDFDALARSVAVLRAAHLARTRTNGSRDAGPAIETYHDRVREAVVLGLDAAARRACHVRLAIALEAEDGRDPDAVATQWIEAGEPARAAAYATEAAEKAFGALAYDRAAHLYERAIDLELAAEDSAARADTRTQLRVRLGEALASAGRGADAARAFLAAAADVKGEPALDLRRRAAEELLIAGQIEPGLAALREVLGQLGMSMPSGPLVTLLLLIVLRLRVVLRGLGYTLRRESEISRSVLLRIDASNGTARALTFVDPILSAYFQTRMLLLALRAGEPYRIAYGLALEASWVASKGVGTRARTDAIFARAAEAARQSGAPNVVALQVGAGAFAALVQGRLAEAVELSDRAIGMLGENAPGMFWEVRAIKSTALWALSAMGDLAQLAARMEPALREADDRHDVVTQTVLRTGTLNMVWLRAGDPKLARNLAENAMKLWTTRGAYHNQHWWGAIALVNVDLYEGKGSDAWERIAREWPRARRAFVFASQLVQFDARHVRARCAVLAAAQASGREREALLGKALRDVRWFERAGPPYGAPWVSHLRACIAAVRGDREAAAAGLARSVPGFDATPVPLWAAAARWQLARLLHGDEARAHREHALAVMTAQGIADPARMVLVFAPGFEGLGS